MANYLDMFRHAGADLKVEYVETIHPNDDVECDVYRFIDDASRDLAILRVKPNGKTPRQQILLGNETLEGFVGGSGAFVHNDKTYTVSAKSDTCEFSVGIGDVMQWHAGSRGLICYEICSPPYADGRFEDLEDGCVSTKSREKG